MNKVIRLSVYSDIIVLFSVGQQKLNLETASEILLIKRL